MILLMMTMDGSALLMVSNYLITSGYDCNNNGWIVNETYGLTIIIFPFQYFAINHKLYVILMYAVYGWIDG